MSTHGDHRVSRNADASGNENSIDNDGAAVDMARGRRKRKPLQDMSSLGELGMGLGLEKIFCFAVVFPLDQALAHRYC